MERAAKLIEEPPPHLVFVFCTTEQSKVIPTVRSRCQVFAFQRPRLQEIVAVLRRVCEGEGIDAPDSALSLIARGAGGSFRDAISTLDQLAAATGKQISVQDVLQLGAAVEEDALFRLCDTIVDRDVAGALVLVEELSERGQDLGQLTKELLEHLRQLLLVQHLGPRARLAPADRGVARPAPRAGEPAPGADRAAADRPPRRRARGRAPGRRSAATVGAGARQGDAPAGRPGPRVARPSCRSVGIPPACRCSRRGVVGPLPRSRARGGPGTSTAGCCRASAARSPELSLEQLQEAWPRSVLPAVKERSIPIATLLAEASPTGLDSDTVTLSFQPGADFHRKQVDEPKNLTLVRDALYEVTGRRLAVVTEVGESADDDGREEQPLGEQDLISLLKSDLNATEIEEIP